MSKSKPLYAVTKGYDFEIGELGPGRWVIAWKVRCCHNVWGRINGDPGFPCQYWMVVAFEGVARFCHKHGVTFPEKAYSHG